MRGEAVAVRQVRSRRRRCRGSMRLPRARRCLEFPFRRSEEVTHEAARRRQKLPTDLPVRQFELVETGRQIPTISSTVICEMSSSPEIS